MNEEQKAEMHSCIFQGYIEKSPGEDVDGWGIKTFMGYEFYIHLTLMKEQIRGEEKPLELPKHFKIKVYCPSMYKEKEEDKYNQRDETLGRSLIPSIHVGFLIEFRGTAYRKSQNGDRHVVIPQQIKTANEIKMDRHYIRIMPPSEESVKRYKAHIKAEKNKFKEHERWQRKWFWKSWIWSRIEDVKEHWVAVTLAILCIIAGFIIAVYFN